MEHLQLTQIQPYGEIRHRPERVVIFANGIKKTFWGAMESAQSLVRDRVTPLFLCYTPDYISNALNGPLAWAPTIFLRDTGDSPDRLAHDIRFWVRRRVTVELHAHSRGTLVAKRALMRLGRLTREQHDRIDLSFYAPVALPPISRVGRASIYINQQDWIAKLGMSILNNRRTAFTIRAKEYFNGMDSRDTEAPIRALVERDSEEVENPVGEYAVAIGSLKLLNWRSDSRTGTHDLSEYLARRGEGRGSHVDVLQAVALTRIWAVANHPRGQSQNSSQA